MMRALTPGDLFHAMWDMDPDDVRALVDFLDGLTVAHSGAGWTSDMVGDVDGSEYWATRSAATTGASYAVSKLLPRCDDCGVVHGERHRSYC